MTRRTREAHLERTRLVGMLSLPVLVAFNFGFGIEEGLFEGRGEEEPRLARMREGGEERRRGEADLDFEEI